MIMSYCGLAVPDSKNQRARCSALADTYTGRGRRVQTKKKDVIEGLLTDNFSTHTGQ